MRVLVLTRYGRLGASSRLRFLQHMPWLRDAGVDCTVQAFFSDEMLQTRYQSGRYPRMQVLSAYGERVRQLMRCRQFDLVWIEKEALPWLPAWFECFLLRDAPYVLDYDDAIFHNYDLHASKWVRRSLGRRIDRLMARASLVVSGNEYLAQRARDAGAPWVEVVPTVVDLDHYECASKGTGYGGAAPCIVWIGSPSTVQYLAQIEEPLTMLARQFPFRLRVVGATLAMPGVNVECVPWSEATEAQSIAQCDVGIMPLADSPWERGKCGYKLIQYMACGLPVVASPVGVNQEIVQEGQNGYLAEGGGEWVEKLLHLLGDPGLREVMGRAGRLRVEAKYCVQQVAPRLAVLLCKAGVGDEH